MLSAFVSKTLVEVLISAIPFTLPPPYPQIFFLVPFSQTSYLLSLVTKLHARKVAGDIIVWHNYFSYVIRLKRHFVYVLFRPTTPSDSEWGFAFLFFGFRDTVTLLSTLKGGEKNERLTDQHAVLVCPLKFLNQLIFLQNFEWKLCYLRRDLCPLFFISLWSVITTWPIRSIMRLRRRKHHLLDSCSVN